MSDLEFARLSADGTHMLKVYEDFVMLEKDGEIQWEKSQMYSTRFAVTFSPDNRFFTLGDHGKLSVHSCADGSLIAQTKYHPEPDILDVCWSPCSRYIASAWGEKGGLRVWDTQEGTIREFSYHAAGVSFSPDGKYLAVCGKHENVSVWDTETWESKELDRSYQYELWCATWSADGAYLVVAGRDVVLLYETRTLGWEPAVCLSTSFSAIEIKPSLTQKNLCLLYDPEKTLIVLDCDSGKFIECSQVPGKINTLSSSGVVCQADQRVEVFEPYTHKLLSIVALVLQSSSPLADPRIWEKVHKMIFPSILRDGTKRQDEQQEDRSDSPEV